MCRIAGIYDPTAIDLSRDITVMRDGMKHGGPDGEGIYLDDNLPLAFGHRRLSLLDLSEAGHQPMEDLDGKLQIIFNGEIYNFLELKNELKGLGHSFKTTCDTEVILKAYLQWGKNCFGRFSGMFALAIFDKRSSQLLLARDHAGIKPLYYSISNNSLYFASEIRAFKRVKPNWPENVNWRISFLTFGYLPEPLTTLQNVSPLKKGTLLTIDLPDFKLHEYSFSQFAFTSKIDTLPEAVAAVKTKLTAAVERHLISDAPIGLFLSGGVDSSLLTLLSYKTLKDNLHTLSIVFEDEKFSEAKYQKMIIDRTGAHHSSFLIKETEFAESLPDILQAMDQPSIDGINSYFICKYAHKSGLKAVLSGVGADELFGGYHFYGRANRISVASRLPSFLFGMAKHFPKYKNKKIAFLKRKDIFGEYLLNRGLYTPDETANILNCTVGQVEEELAKIDITGSLSIKNNKNKSSWTDQNLYMQGQLLKDVDYMGMWHSLEVRVPFLDKDLMETAYSIAPSVKYNILQKKHLLIKAFKDVLPEEIYRRKKQGFTFPFKKWIIPVQTTEQRNPLFRQKLQNLKAERMQWIHYWGYLVACHRTNIRYYHQQVKRVLFLNLSAFFFTGGIEKFNRAFLKALSDLEHDGKVVADSWSAYDREVDTRYFNPKHYRCFKAERWKFVLEAWRGAANYDVVVLGHINIAVAGWGIKKLFPKKDITIITHGIEVWEKLSGVKSAVLQMASQVLAVSNFTRNKIIEVQKINAGKVVVFHNTIDPYFVLPVNFCKPEYLLNRYGISNTVPVIFTLTRLSDSEKYKGYDKVIEVLPKLKSLEPNLKYIVAGKADKKERERIEGLTQANGLSDTVILTGFVKDEEVVDHFLLADVFVMPSQKEGFGIVFIEAMACGLPVIAGNKDGSVDALRNGELGLLVDPDDESEILRALINTLDPARPIINSGVKREIQRKVYKLFGFDKYKQNLEKILA